MMAPATRNGCWRESWDERFRLQNASTFVGEKDNTIACGSLQTVSNRLIGPCRDLSSTTCE